MKNLNNFVKLLCCLSFICGFNSPALAGKPSVKQINHDVIIAGGNPFGLRYSQSGKICYYYNNEKNTDGDCLVYPSSNSGDAIDLLQQGKANFAMVQTDWLMHAKDGTSRYSKYGQNNTIRLVTTLSIESVIVAVNKDLNVNSLNDLKNLKIDIGKDNTYRNIISLGLLDIAGLDKNDLKLSLNGTQDEAIDSVCNGSIDGTIFILPNPNPIVDMMSAQCNVKFISLNKSEVKNFTKQYKGFYKSTIPSQTYWAQESDIQTVGVYTALITTIDTDKKSVHSLRESIANNIDNFVKTHPMLYNINLSNINTDINVKYYDFD